MKILVTGTAGFIGFFVARKLLELGHRVIGIDCVNDYYDVLLKEDRLKILKKNPQFVEIRVNIADKDIIEQVFKQYKPHRVLNLAAQAGVRYGLTNPHAYIESNITGFLNILEGCRNFSVEHFVFASTGSVYGANTKMPFSENDATSHQLSLYSATKKSNEVMAHSYSHLFGMPSTGLRFFNVYGPWGRPDSALFKFVKNMYENKPIEVYNNGNMLRDFTYVDDIAEGILKVLLGEPSKINNGWVSNVSNPDASSSGVAPFRIYNIGNSKPVELMKYIELIESETGKKADIKFMPIQPGEVYKSEADNTKLYEDFGFKPSVCVEDGVGAFVGWYKEYYGINRLVQQI